MAKKSGGNKTNAMRILDKLGIEYETAAYDDDGEHKLEKGAAGMTAQKIGVDPATVFKTIVMRNESKEIFVFLQNALHEINLKKARAASGSKEIAPVKPDELLALTGYIRGGCSPLGMKKQFKTFICVKARVVSAKVGYLHFLNWFNHFFWNELKLVIKTSQMLCCIQNKRSTCSKQFCSFRSNDCSVCKFNSSADRF